MFEEEKGSGEVMYVIVGMWGVISGLMGEVIEDYICMYFVVVNLM